MEELEQVKRDIEALHKRLNVLEQGGLADTPAPASFADLIVTPVVNLSPNSTVGAEKLADVFAHLKEARAELAALSQRLDAYGELRSRVQALELLVKGVN